MKNKILATLWMLVGALAGLWLSCLPFIIRHSIGRHSLFEPMFTIPFGLFVMVYGVTRFQYLFYQGNERNKVMDFTGSCRYGTGYYMSEGVAFAKLTINPDSLFIRGGFGAFWAPNLLFCNFCIPKDQIIKISQFSRSLIGGSFQIEHNCSEAPPFIVFSPNSLTKVVMELERLDYKFNWNLPT